MNRNIIFRLLYRASRDGDSPRDYHTKCDGKRNTLCIIKTTKGCKFGGYTDTEIIGKGEGNFAKDPNSFLFSLNLMKIYENMKKEDFAVIHAQSWGPIFRDDALRVWDKNFFSYHQHKVGTKNSSIFGFDKDYELNNNEEFFSIKEFEVFQILIE